MMKNYLSFLIVLAVLGCLELQAQVDITFNVDLSNENVVTNPGGNDVEMQIAYLSTHATFDVGATVALSDAGSGIWTYTAAGADREILIYQVSYYNGSNMKSLFTNPAGCQGSNGARYETALPTTSATFNFVLGDCMDATWDGANWAGNEPFDGANLTFNDDYTVMGRLDASNLNIANAKTVTVASGATLSIHGLTEIGNVAKALPPVSQGFESATYINDNTSLVGDMTVAYSTEAGTFTEGAQSLRVTSPTAPGSNGNKINIEFEVETEGIYSVSYDIRAVSETAYRQSQLINGSNAKQFANNNVNVGWKTEVFDDHILTAGTNTLHIRTGALGDFYVDNIVATPVVAPIDFGNLVVQSGGSLQARSAINNHVTFDRNTSFGAGARKYSFVGSPIEADLNVTGANLGNEDVYWYDEAEGFDNGAGVNRWKDASAAVLTPGWGYTQTSQEVISFTGFPNSGDIVLAGLSKTTAGTTSEGDQGWHLLSNPYGAAIKVSSFLNGNAGVEQSISIWDDGTGSFGGRGNGGSYITANEIATVNGSAKDFEGYIGSMQGFFVKVLADATDVGFADSMMVRGENTDATYFRKADSQSDIAGVKLSIQSTKNYAELFVGLIDEATVGYDARFDASKLLSGTDLEFYSLIDDHKFAIQALPLTDGVSTELAFNLGESAAELTLSVESLQNIPSGMTLYLNDAVTGKSYDLSETHNFSFNAQVGSNQNRFSLTYSAKEVLANVFNNNKPIYRYSDGHLHVDFNEALSVDSYAIYDLSGKIISKENLAEGALRKLEIPMDVKGISIVKISTSSGVFTRKFIF